jgi:Peptidase A4 family
MGRLPSRRQVALAVAALLLALTVPLMTNPGRALASGGAALGSSVGQSSSSPPAAPSNVKVAPYGALDFYITWNSNSTNQTGFQVYNGVTTQNVTTATQYNYLWAVAQPSTYMCFAVRAYNASGYSAWAGMWTCATTPPGGQPAAPTNVVVTGYSTTAIKISFVNQASNETAFLFYNGVTTITYNAYNEPAKGSSFSVLWTGLQPHTWMCFQVASYNQWGRSAYVPSSWACTWTQGVSGVPAGNASWNGYVTNGTSATDVIADWTVPTLQNCGLAGSAEAPEWIGLGGVNTPLVQIGTQQLCGAVATAVYEIVPEMSKPAVITLCGIECGVVTPGDNIEAEVRYLGGNQYYISITDYSWDWTWSQTVTQPASNATPQTAEWIVEDTGALADFGTVEFTNCFWNKGTGLSALTSATMYEGADSSGLQTSVSAISQYGGNGPNFTVSWLHS